MAQLPYISAYDPRQRRDNRLAEYFIRKNLADEDYRRKQAGLPAARAHELRMELASQIEDVAGALGGANVLPLLSDAGVSGILSGNVTMPDAQYASAMDRNRVNRAHAEVEKNVAAAAADLFQTGQRAEPGAYNEYRAALDLPPLESIPLDESFFTRYVTEPEPPTIRVEDTVVRPGGSRRTIQELPAGEYTGPGTAAAIPDEVNTVSEVGRQITADEIAQLEQHPRWHHVKRITTGTVLTAQDGSRMLEVELNNGDIEMVELDR